MSSPQDNAPIPIDSFFAPEKLVLWVAIALAAIFIGFLAFDTLRRNKRMRGADGQREGFRAAWARRFQQAKILRQDLKSYNRERARRKEREGGKRPGTKR